jgi:hypothetical protein
MEEGLKMWKFYSFFLVIPLLVSASNFWSHEKACYWETNCQFQNKTKSKKEKNWKKEYELIVDKVLKGRDKFLNSLPPQKVRELYQKIKSYAVANPTEKNLEAFTYMTDYIRRKSVEFMYAYTHYIAEHPKYNISAKVGTTSWSYRTLQVAKAKRILKWLKENSDKVGLYFVCSPKLQICIEASKPIKELVERGIPVVSVVPDNCDDRFPNCSIMPDAIRKFRIRVLPAYYAFVKTKKGPKVIPIGQGLIPTDRLLYELFRVANYELKGRWIDATQILP